MTTRSPRPRPPTAEQMREAKFWALIEERYGPIHMLEAELHSQTPDIHRRGAARRRKTQRNRTTDSQAKRRRVKASDPTSAPNEPSGPRATPNPPREDR